MSWLPPHNSVVVAYIPTELVQTDSYSQLCLNHKVAYISLSHPLFSFVTIEKSMFEHSYINNKKYCQHFWFSYILILSSSHPPILTSSLYLTSSHPHILPSSYPPYILTPSHPHIIPISSHPPDIITSSHPHILLISSHPPILPSSHPPILTPPYILTSSLYPLVIWIGVGVRHHDGIESLL